jgi:hypothetical protein
MSPRTSTLAGTAFAVASILPLFAAAQDGGNAAGTPPAQAGEKFPLPPDVGRTTTGARGSLAIRAIQGTEGAADVGPAEVTVQLFHRGMLFDTINTQLDEHGVVVLEDLPVGAGLQPVVQVAYAGVTYQMTGGVMDSEHPDQKIDVTCYDLTDEPPPWRVSMRHVMATPSPEGLRVTEVLVIDNPGDRTWRGVGGPDGRRMTTVFTLPRDAADVHLERGFHDWCCTALRDGRLVNSLPLMPERTEMVFSYTLPASAKGVASIDIVAPAETDHVMVVVPDDVAARPLEGLEHGGSQDLGQSRVRYFVASGQQPGAAARLAVTGLVVPVAANTVADTAPVGIARIVAGVGGALILLAAIVVFLMRRGGTASPAPARARALAHDR